jgi:hypothetical protein
MVSLVQAEASMNFIKFNDAAQALGFGLLGTAAPAIGTLKLKGFVEDELSDLGKNGRSGALLLITGRFMIPSLVKKEVIGFALLLIWMRCREACQVAGIK